MVDDLLAEEGFDISLTDEELSPGRFGFEPDKPKNIFEDINDDELFDDDDIPTGGII